MVSYMPTAYSPSVDQNGIQTLSNMNIPYADKERKRALLDAWKSYRGEFPPPLKIQPDQPNDNIISNRCAPIVDKGVSFLFGKTLNIEAAKETTEPTNTVKDAIRAVWGDDDDRMTLLSQIGINGGITGMSFVKIMPPDMHHPHTRILPLDSCIVRVVTDNDDVSCILAYVIEYAMANEWNRRQIISRIDPNAPLGLDYDQEMFVDHWIITNYMRKGQIGSWQQTGEPDTWPYPFAPIDFCQNLPNPNETWGIPDLTPDLIGLNHSLNFIQSNTSRIIKYHGHPKTWIIGMDADAVNTAVDDLICLPSSDSKIGNLEMVQTLTDQRNFAMDLRGHMDEQSRVPAIALGRETSLPRGDISGVALKLLLQPIMEKTTLKQRLYGSLIRRVTRAALVIEGVLSLDEYQNYEIQLHFQNIMPEDDLQAAQTALLLRQIGVSLQSALNQLGFDPEQEIERLKHEQATIGDLLPQLSATQKTQLAASSPSGKGAINAGADIGAKPHKAPVPSAKDPGGTK